MSLDGLTHPPAASPPDETQLTILKRIDANVGLLGSAINDVKARVSVLETWKNEVAAGVHSDPFPAAPVHVAVDALPPRPPAPSITSEVRESMRVNAVTLQSILKSTNVQTIADLIKIGVAIGAVIGGSAWAFYSQAHPSIVQNIAPTVTATLGDAGTPEKKP